MLSCLLKLLCILTSTRYALCASGTSLANGLMALILNFRPSSIYHRPAYVLLSSFNMLFQSPPLFLHDLLSELCLRTCVAAVHHTQWPASCNSPFLHSPPRTTTSNHCDPIHASVVYCALTMLFFLFSFTRLLSFHLITASSPFTTFPCHCAQWLLTMVTLTPLYNLYHHRPV